MKVLIKDKYVDLATVYAIDFTEEFLDTHRGHYFVPESINLHIYGQNLLQIKKEPTLYPFRHNIEKTLVEPIIITREDEGTYNFYKPIFNRYEIIKTHNEAKLYPIEEISAEKERQEKEYQKNNLKINEEFQKLKEKVVNLWKDSKTLEKKLFRK